jgi:hypothetical protein
MPIAHAQTVGCDLTKQPRIKGFRKNLVLVDPVMTAHRAGSGTGSSTVMEAVPAGEPHAKIEARRGGLGA